MINFKSSSYVQALYELGVENNSTNLLYDESKLFLDLINKNNNLLTYLSDIQISIKEKESFIKELTNNELFKNFLMILILDKRIKGLKTILDKFVKRINDERGIIEGTIYTIEPIDEDQIKEIEKGMSRKINSKVQLKNIIDKEIIGGIKVVINDDVWDYSLQSQIIELTKRILEEGE